MSSEQHIQDWIRTSPLANGHDFESSAQFFKNMQLDSTTFFLAYHQNKAIGCSMFFQDGNGTVGNYWDAVLPEYRCNGVGSLMIQKRLEKAKLLGYSHLVAQCMDTSTRLY